MKAKKNREETETMINIHAWKDPEFKKELLKNPKEALKKLGMKNIPASINIKVIEQKHNEWAIVLREPPEKAEDMSIEELKKTSAAHECIGLCKTIICTCSPDWW